ncbi:hypothetical protein PR048_020344 [Dryococelus australis]|uniref:ATP-dependent DNA helicase n=1 Tax=Dryococelus australis TaxID=614101 RepID=A0ABQ9H619_9NEOP|nr:hypothetical protein PR048_020344 [Dryococelus australis]
MGKIRQRIGKCDTLGILEDDKHWDATMEEVVLCRSPAKYCPTRSSYGTSTKKLCQKIFFTGFKEFIRQIVLFSMNRKKISDFGMPTPQRIGELSSAVIKELDYDTAASDVHNGEGGLYFLDAPGGKGKTFLLNLFLAQLRKDRNIALAVDSSSIAATLLSGGRTTHSVFKLSRNFATEETPT